LQWLTQDFLVDAGLEEFLAKFEAFGVESLEDLFDDNVMSDDELKSEIHMDDTDVLKYRWAIKRAKKSVKAETHLQRQSSLSMLFKSLSADSSDDEAASANPIPSAVPPPMLLASQPSLPRSVSAPREVQSDVDPLPLPESIDEEDHKNAPELDRQALQRELEADPVLMKYCLLLIDVPAATVRHKLLMDRVDEDKIRLFEDAYSLSHVAPAPR
jgi:hypothetical protein